MGRGGGEDSPGALAQLLSPIMLILIAKRYREAIIIIILLYLQKFSSHHFSSTVYNVCLIRLMDLQIMYEYMWRP